MFLRPAVESDIVQIAALERAPAACAFVAQWSEERHRTTLASSDARYLVVDGAPGELAAFAILRGLTEASRAIELKRLVVAIPDHGLGRRILTELIRMAFDDLGAHRLFLDVFEDNALARHLYESMGFVLEGTMYEAGLRDGQWYNLSLMSMLAGEYAVRARAVSQ